MSGLYGRQYDYPCPVCHASMTTYSDHLDNLGPLLESGETCPFGCYVHTYAYGYTEVMVNIRGHKINVGFNYMDAHEDVLAVQETVDFLVKNAQATLIEDLRASRYPDTP